MHSKILEDTSYDATLHKVCGSPEQIAPVSDEVGTGKTLPRRTFLCSKQRADRMGRR